MASALTDKLSRLVKEMRGQARITESNVQGLGSLMLSIHCYVVIYKCQCPHMFKKAPP